MSLTQALNSPCHSEQDERCQKTPCDWGPAASLAKECHRRKDCQCDNVPESAENKLVDASFERHFDDHVVASISHLARGFKISDLKLSKLLFAVS